jgi:hypothetical protein
MAQFITKAIYGHSRETAAGRGTILEPWRIGVRWIGVPWSGR